MKQTRKWILVVSLLLSVAMATSGTLAYLSDTKSDVNVMTLGSVYIEQHEQERDGNGGLKDFEREKPLMPVPSAPETYTNLEGKQTDSHQSEYKFLATSDLKNLPNVVDKIVTVENIGKSDAYVRTLIAFEVAESVNEVKSSGTHIGLMRNDYANRSQTDSTLPGNSDWSWEWLTDPITVKDQKYAVAIATHNAILPKDETTIPSLLQVYMKSNGDNEYVAKLGDTYEILVLSQAVQSEGFADAPTALNAAFNNGVAITASQEKIAEWFDGVVDEHAYDEKIDPDMVVLTIDTFDEFKQFDVAVDNNGEYKGVKVANNTKVYVELNTDIDLSAYSDFTGIGNGNGNGFDGVFNGKGHTIKNWTVSANWNYYCALFRTTANLDVKNLTIENFNLGSATTKGTNYGAVIGAVGGTDVLVDNVTVKNCKIMTQRTLGAVVGGITNGKLTIQNCTVEDVELHNAGNDVSANRVAGVLLGNGWSHHDAEADGIYESNNTATNVVWFAGGVQQPTVPSYTYNK